MNIDKDTKVDRVLISREFYYFGSAAPDVPKEPLNYPLFFERECLERGDSGRCLDSHWFFEPFGYPVPAVGGVERHYAAAYNSFLRTKNRFTRAQVANSRLAFFFKPR